MKKSKANLISIHGTINGVLYNNYTDSQPLTGIISFYSLWLFNIYAEYTMKKYQVGWSTSWNQDCQEKYQYPQICRWHHPYGIKWRETKKPLDEGERGEWKSWLKTQHAKNEDHGIWSITSRQIGGGGEGNGDRLYFLGLKNHCRRWLQPWNYKMLAPWKKSYDQPRQHIKKQRYYIAYKGLHSQSYGFSSSCVWMWKMDHWEGWAPKNWCFWTVVLEKTLESPLDCREIKPVNPKGNQSWIFIGRSDAEAGAPILWSPDAKSRLIRKDPNAGKDWRQEEKGMTEDEMVGWHHWLDGHEFEQAPGVGDGQGNLAYYSPWGHKVSDTTEQVNNNSLWGQHVLW